MTEEYIGDGKTHVWRLVSNLKVGDRIHRWGDDLEIKNIGAVGNRIFITYDDGGVEKISDYDADDALITKASPP